MKRILIVEDDEQLLKALVLKFTQEGFAVQEAADGKKGFEIAVRYQPDIILLDILMPKMDGLTMLSQLRQNNWGKDVPVIILTNLDDTQKMAESLEQEATYYLIKSDWKLEDLVKKVKEKLEIAK